MSPLPLMTALPWFLLAACTPPDIGNKEDTADTDDTDTDDTDTDDTDTDDTDTAPQDTGPDEWPATQEMFVNFLYPAAQEVITAGIVLLALGCELQENETSWVCETDETVWTVHMDSSVENLLLGLQTPGAVVVYAGHSNYGLGGVFSELQDTSPIPEIRSISDLFNMGTEWVGVNEEYLIYSQAYPNLVIPDEQVAAAGEVSNYIIEELGLLRYPNDQGIGAGQTFPYTNNGGTRYHYTEEGVARLLVKGGAADVPPDLQYSTLLLKSCHSDRYFSENFDHGNVFFTDDNVYSEDFNSTVDVFIKGMIKRWDFDTIVAEMNEREDVYHWHHFD